MSSPLTESTYGSPPYHESALKSALRILASGGSFGAGLGAVRPGSNFGEAFLSSMGASSKAYSAAQQAAQAYSMKQQEMQAKQEADVLRQEFLKAEIEKMKRPEKPEKPEKLDPWKLPPEEQAARLDWETRLKRATNIDTSVDEAGPELSGPALDTAARVYLKTGQLPSMGMGKAGVKNRTRILNRASEMNPGSDVAGNTASYRAGQRALSDLSLQKNRLESFENTAAENTKIIWDFIGRVPETGTRFGNKWGRWLKSQAGDPDVASFNAAVNVVMNEYARIVTQFGGTNIMTDTARKEMERIISGDFTKAQLVSVMKTIQKDAANRLESTDRQIEQINQEIGGIGGGVEGTGGRASKRWKLVNGELVPE